MALLQRVCELDLEGIVAKQKFGPYVTDREHSTWFKILNRGYSQMQGREELFDRERHSEPVAGWHVCALVCEAQWVTHAAICISACYRCSSILPFPQGSIVPLDYFLFDMGETNFPIVQFLRYF